MGWLGTRLRKKPSEDEIVEEELIPEPPSGPSLVLLVPEIAGGSSYKLHEFHDVEPAIEVIESTIPAIRAGIHAFWALQERPLDSTDVDPKGEGMVLIRTNADSHVVYVVSFVDIESGESFARFEVKRGLDLGLVMIYWASHVEIDQTGAGFSLSPSEPPLTASSEPRPLRDWNRAPVVAAGAVAAAAGTPERVDDALVPEPDIVDSVDVVDAAPPPVAPAPSGAMAEAGERYRQAEADAAGMIEEEEVVEPSTLPDLAASAALNGNGKNGHAAEATVELEAVEETLEAEPDAEITAYAGDEEIADRILQEALGDDPIDLAAAPGLTAAAAIVDEVAPDAPTRTPDPEPELNLFNGPRKTSRSKKKATPPEAAPEVAAALTPDSEPEAPVVESVAAEAPTVEESTLAAEPEVAIEDEQATVEASEPVIAEEPEPIVAEAAPVVEDEVEQLPVFTPAPEVASEVAPVFTPAPDVAEPPFTAFDSESDAVPAMATAIEGEPVDQDAIAQVEKILRIPRWEKKEDPFKGFNSPPGRF